MSECVILKDSFLWSTPLKDEHTDDVQSVQDIEFLQDGTQFSHRTKKKFKNNRSHIFFNIFHETQANQVQICTGILN